jgi:hypothetical protein
MFVAQKLSSFSFSGERQGIIGFDKCEWTKKV